MVLTVGKSPLLKRRMPGPSLTALHDLLQLGDWIV